MSSLVFHEEFDILVVIGKRVIDVVVGFQELKLFKEPDSLLFHIVH